RDLGPGLAAVVRAVQLDAEVAVIERGVPAAARIGERERHVVADERGARDAVPLAPGLGHEQAPAGGDHELAHPHPPDSACITYTSLAGRTGSESRSRSSICWPSTNTIMWRRSAPWSSSTYPRRRGLAAKTASRTARTESPSMVRVGHSTCRSRFGVKETVATARPYTGSVIACAR